MAVRQRRAQPLESRLAARRLGVRRALRTTALLAAAGIAVAVAVKSKI